MTHFNDLPELVICFIIKHVCSVNSTPDEFYHRLPLVAVNRRFRHIGLSLVFDLLYVVETNFDTIVDNYDLVKCLQYRPLIKKIKIGTHLCSDSRLAMYRLVACLGISLDTSGSKEQLVVEKLVQLFPNIASVTIKGEMFSSGVSDFAAKWVDLLGKQLRSFHCYSLFPQTGPSQTPPLELTSLAFNFGMDPIKVTPKFNPLTLRHLVIHSPPKEFDWQCFQLDDNQDKPIVFSNLVFFRYVAFKIRKSTIAGPSQRCARQPQLHFPKLRKLEYLTYNIEHIVFKPTVISKHLDLLSISKGTAALRSFESPLIKSVGILDIDLSRYNEGMLDDRFYQLTNHLFGAISITKESGVHLESNIAQLLDYQRIRWHNLTRIEVSGNRHREFLQHLHLFPALRNLLLIFGHFSRDDPHMAFDCLYTGTLDQLQDHRLEKFIISGSGGAKWPRLYIVGIALLMAKTFKHLRVIKVSEELEDKVQEEMEDLVGQYPHVEAIEVEDAPVDIEGWRLFENA